MIKLVVVLLASLAVCWAASLLGFPIQHVAFTVGGFLVTWTMLLFAGCGIFFFHFLKG